jgi:death-on-curing protein
MLDAAPHRPRSGYYASLNQQVAALFQSLAHNHAFIDGNERVVFATMTIFVRLNGFALRATGSSMESRSFSPRGRQPDIVQLMLGLW